MMMSSSSTWDNWKLKLALDGRRPDKEKDNDFNINTK